MNVLVSGAAGYLGSHTCIELIKAGHHITAFDNLSNGSKESLNRVEKITGKGLDFFNADLLDKKAISRVFAASNAEVVVHFAGNKEAGESVQMPLRCYQNNISGTLSLLRMMDEFSISKILFSSSDAVYGDSNAPFREDSFLSPLTPYAFSKLTIENILSDLYKADNRKSIAILRIFNPIGAHKSSRIGDSPINNQDKLISNIIKVAAGKLSHLNIYGNDYPTKDGTGVRDYIHVTDLALGYVRALKKVESNSGVFTYNLGTGKGRSVLDIVGAFEKALGKKIPYKFSARRPGDLAISYADCSKAKNELEWSAEIDIEEMCEDIWRWQTANPDGYV